MRVRQTSPNHAPRTAGGAAGPDNDSRFASVFVVSHTHWDREWYEPFQRFRLRLVDLVDEVLELLDSDSGYQCFMLDGQTILIEDYLAVRPERESDLRRLVRAGKLLIGPWYVLPDEFLVSPEALIRNLQWGWRASRRFGDPMEIGYIPDLFGHIGQMPQILREFGIEEAVLARGLEDEPVELWWEAPDGSRVLLIYLRESYNNFAWIPRRPDLFTDELVRRVQDYLAEAATSNVLLLNGGDHTFPQPDLPQLLAAARQARPDLDIQHSTLPRYLAAVKMALDVDDIELPIVKGELRSAQRHHLLPAVLSTRMWIKQANDAAETLLERYAEPLSAWSCIISAGSMHRLGGPDRRAQLDEAWRLLLQNQPHDSICGCSIDQVHAEMRPRFDGVMQIGEALAREGLERLAAVVNLPSGGAAEPREAFDGWQMNPWPPAERAIVVFNPTSTPRTDRVEVDVRLPGPPEAVEVIAEDGTRLPVVWRRHPETFKGEQVLGGLALRQLLKSARAGHFAFRRIRNLRLRITDHTAELDILLRDDERAPDMTALHETLNRIETEAPLATVTEARVRTFSMATGRLGFVASDVPGHGYRTFHLQPTKKSPSKSDPRSPISNPQSLISNLQSPVIENDFFQVTADLTAGTLTLHDHRTNRTFAGLNRLVDGGDAGDLYSYNPPANNRLVMALAAPASVEATRSVVDQTLALRYSLDVPASLTPDRQASSRVHRGARTEVTIPLDVVVTARLLPGVPRLDVTTEIENRARNHRLRAHFPMAEADRAWAEAHFDVVRRPTQAPPPRPTWVEDPPATFPQRGWTAIETPAGDGLMVAARGLPEVETTPDDSGVLAIKLTLLRSVGDLSRDDLRTRRGHAGPTFETPGAQCPGPHRFEVSLIPYTGGWQTAMPEAHAFRAPLIATSRVLGDGPLPPVAGLLDVEPGQVVLSAVKQSADGGAGLIVRLWNPTGDRLRVRLKSCFPLVMASRGDLREQPGESLSLDEGQVSLNLQAKEIVTLCLKFDSRI